MKIAVDLDDVVVDFFARVVKCYNKEFGELVSVDEVTGWDDNPIKKSPHFGDGQMFPNWWAWWESRGLWSDCDAIDGAIGGLYTLHAAGHQVELVTSKPVWARPDLFKWLHEWNPYFDSLVIVDENSPNKLSKSEVSDAVLLIDDRPSNVLSWVDCGRPAVLFTQPWNVAERVNRRHLYRASDWRTIIGLVGEADGR